MTETMRKPRTIVWFSCGAASAVAAKMVGAPIGDTGAIEVVYCKPGTDGPAGGEHPDNARFLRDVEAWVKRPIRVLTNDKYRDHFDVFRKRKYIKGVRGAPCTLEMKREMRERFQREGDVHVFGYTADEADRAGRFRERNPDLRVSFPLIEHGVTKEDCLGVLFHVGIEMPVMYRPQESGSAYNHNNCIGCVKGGMGYWNKIRVDFPEHFARMAQIEREVGHAVLKDEDGPVWLDELDPERGRFEDEPAISCGVTCYALAGQMTD